MFSRESDRGQELDVCEDDAYSRSEVHSGLEVYIALIDLQLMAGVCTSLEVYEVEIKELYNGMFWQRA